MKLSILSAAFSVLASLTAATPAPHSEKLVESAQIVKRATIQDVATTGFATQGGGTTGGKGGNITTVTNVAELTAVFAKGKDTRPKIILVKGTISGNVKLKVPSNTSIIGLKGARLVNIGLYIREVKNVIIRNIISESVLAVNGDSFGIHKSSNVWIDHCELFSAPTNNKDLYDGLVDVTHAVDWVTISNNYFHDHWKGSLIGSGDSNGKEDTGHLTVTQHNNHWYNISSRTPSLRFGTGHIYNSYFELGLTGINTRKGAQVLVQSNVFKNVAQPLLSAYSSSVGYATAIDNDFGIGNNSAPVGNITATSLPYSYNLLGSSNVRPAVVGKVGATLDF